MPAAVVEWMGLGGLLAVTHDLSAGIRAALPASTGMLSYCLEASHSCLVSGLQPGKPCARRGSYSSTIYNCVFRLQAGAHAVICSLARYYVSCSKPCSKVRKSCMGIIRCVGKDLPLLAACNSARSHTLVPPVQRQLQAACWLRTEADYV